MTNKHLNDAKTWLKHAENEHRKQDPNHRVTCAMSVHSVIKSLDALFKEFLSETPTRHDSAVDWFKDRLIKDNHIKQEESNYTRKIQNMLQKKADAEYKAAYFSKSDADKWLNSMNCFAVHSIE